CVLQATAMSEFYPLSLHDALPIFGSDGAHSGSVMLDRWRSWGFVERWRERRELRLRVAEELHFHLEEAMTENLARGMTPPEARRSEEHTSELQSRENLVCRLLLEK